MPRVPTILAGEDIRTANQVPAASAEPTGLDTFAQGLGTVASNLSRIGETLNELNKRRQDSDSAKWVGDSFYQLSNHLNEWQSRPENNSDENYAENFRKYAEDSLKTYQEAAPDERTRRLFTGRVQSFISSRYDQALGVTERTRLEKSKESVINQTGFAIETLRSAQGVPGVDSVSEAETSRLDIRDRVDQIFAGMNPEIARKLRGYVDLEFALGIAPLDAEFAKSIVRSSSDIAEEDKPTALYKVDTLAKVASTQAVEQVDKIRRDYLSTVEAGNAKDPLPLSLYSVYDNPEKEKARDDEKIGVMTETDALVRELAPLNSSSTGRLLEEKRAGIKTESQKLVFDNAVRQLTKVAELRDRDRVSWLLEYNPEIAAISQQLVGLRSDDTRYQSLLISRNEAILKYQGYAPPGVEDSRMFLGLATNDRHLMTREEAERNATHINLGSPREVVERVQQVLASYPGELHQSIAFNDMVTTKGGIRPEYQLVWQNKDQWFVQNFVKALSGTKGLSTLSADSKKELGDLIRDNAQWSQVEQILVAGGSTDEAVALESALVTYATQFHVEQGDKLSVAAKKAVDQLIGSTLGFTKVNGKSLAILRNQGDGKIMTDDEVADVGRRLGVSLRDLDIREVNQDKFPVLARVHPDEKNINRLQALRDVVTRTGFFVTEGDGKSVTLYVTGDDGQTFQLRDRENRAFQIYLSDLPSYTYRDPTGSQIPFWNIPEQLRSQIGPIKEQPTSSVPLKRDYGPGVSWFDKLLGWPEKSTHWPSGGVFKRKEVK